MVSSILRTLCPLGKENMDILTFLSKAIENLSWPIVVVTVLWLFRSPFTALLNAIKDAKFKISRGETTIEGELNTVREKIKKVSEKPLPERVKKSISESPIQAIESSWRDLEQTATATVAVSTPLSLLKIADLLIDKNFLSEKEAEAFYRLYEIKDEATKPCSRYITDAGSALTYSNLAYTLSERIKEKGA